MVHGSIDGHTEIPPDGESVLPWGRTRAPDGVRARHDVRGVLPIPAFRRFWTAFGLSASADWLGLLAQLGFALYVALPSYTDACYAVAAVFAIRQVAGVVLEPLGRLLAPRLHRRWATLGCDVARAGLLLSIPLANTLWWLLPAAFLIEVASLVRAPLAEAEVPDVTPRHRIAAAGQLLVVTGQAAAPVSAAVFTVLALVSRALGIAEPFFDDHPLDLAFFVGAATYLAAAAYAAAQPPPAPGTTSRRVRPRATAVAALAAGPGRMSLLTLSGQIGMTLVCGVIGGVAVMRAASLGGGATLFGLIVLALGSGAALGLALPSSLTAGVTRHRLLGLSVTAAGLVTVVLAVVPVAAITVLLAGLAGALVGLAWVCVQSTLADGAPDEKRARVAAFSRALLRAGLALVLTLGALLAGVAGPHLVRIGDTGVRYDGSAVMTFAAGVVALVLGVIAYRAAPEGLAAGGLLRDLRALGRVSPAAPEGASLDGYFIAIEGGDGAGKSTQAEALASWLTARGHEVVVTREPGGTELGAKLRALLLDSDNAELITPRAEALLYAADRADHVAQVIRPALARGAVVITDRYTDSSIAYQGAGRDLPAEEVAALSERATGGLRPNLTVVLDLPPETARARATETADRMEAESLEFHERVRSAFLTLAAVDPDRYVVVDATADREAVTARIQARLHGEIPLSDQERAELAELDRKAAEEAERRRAEEEARRAEQRALVERCKAEARERAEQRARERAEAKAEAERKAREEAERRARERAERELREREQAAREEAERKAAAEKAAREETARREEQERREREAAERAKREAEERRDKLEEEARKAAEDAEKAAREKAERHRAEQRAIAERAAARAAETLDLRNEKQDDSGETPEPPAADDTIARDTAEKSDVDAESPDDSTDKTDGGKGEDHTAELPVVDDPTETLPGLRVPAESSTERTAELSLADELLGPWRQRSEGSKRRRRS